MKIAFFLLALPVALGYNKKSDYQKTGGYFLCYTL